ncbi:MAG: GTP-dependent dephospho-CoA kinase family protein [Candidatus Odinarchaeota archaeon]
MNFFHDLFDSNQKKSLELPFELRNEFKTPVGKLYIEESGFKPEERVSALLKDKKQPTIVVGDVCALTLGQAGFFPSIAIIDNKTLRYQQTDSYLPDYDPRATITATNPAGQVTHEAVNAIQRGLVFYGKLKKTILVKIEGEEDLLVLPATILAPSGSHVIYGQPGEGIVVLEVTHSIQKHFTELLERFI